MPDPIEELIPDATPTRLSPIERLAVERAIARVVANGPWIGGPEVSTFEADFADYLGGGIVVGCANGTDALALAMIALELPPGAAILVPANEGGYAATAARLAGLVPVPVDIDVITLAPSLSTAAAAMMGRDDVMGIVVTHLHGDPVDISGLDTWRRRLGLVLIEDCAQAHGARRDGRHVGLSGDAGAFSFYPTKNLAGVGDGGAVVFRDPAAARSARQIARYGWDDGRSIVRPRGRNSRLDPLQAAVISARIPFLEERNARRRRTLARYRASAPAGMVLGDPILGTAHHAVLRTSARDAVRRHLTVRQIGTAIHYPVVLGDMPGLQLEASATPVARMAAREILSIPCTAELTEREIERITTALEEWPAA